MFPAGRFASPALPEQIKSVEEELCITFPDQLRSLYLECDGFREPVGNAKYLLALRDEDTIGSLVSQTRFWWHEWNSIVPKEHQIDFTSFLFFGSSSAGESWGIRWRGPTEVIAYHHHMEDEYDILGAEILTVYQQDYSRYKASSH
jgi:hypothetical protein